MKGWRLGMGPVLLLCSGLIFVAESAEVKKVEEKTFPLSAGGSVTLVADEGSIVITSWEKEEVHLKMTKRAWGRNRREAERLLDAIEVRIQEGKDRLVVRELDRRDEDRHFNFFDLFDSDFWSEQGWRDGRIDFELTVPREVQLKLQCDEGDVKVSGTEGTVTIDVDEGDAEVENVVSQRLQVTVDEGDVTLYGLRDRGEGYWKVDADEGRILVEDGVAEEVEVSTDEGEIVLRDIQTLRFWLATDEGDILANFRPRKGGNYNLETDEGDLEITLSEEVHLQVRLRTDEGRIDSDFDLSIRRRDDVEIGEGVIGENRGNLKAYTEEGDILLRKQR